MGISQGCFAQWSKTKSFSIYSLPSVLNELTENTELLPGRSKLWTQGSTSQMLAVYSAWGLHSVTTHQEKSGK